ncbi:MAG: hypothetical protein U1G08_14005 [Verrucomicrobiota bacterium]
MPDPVSHENPNESRSERWRRILIHELLEFFFNFAFLAFFLVAFAWYRRLILSKYHIHYTGYWAPVVEAAILAKVIMIGDALRVGRRLRHWPLIVPTVHRTVAFSILVLVFSVVEHVLGALWHGRPASQGLSELTNADGQGFLAWWLLINVAFLPFFAFKEMEIVLGVDKVRGLFFRSPRNPAGAPEGNSQKSSDSQP